MSELLTTEIDVLTGEVVERQMTADEIENFETIAEESATRQSQISAKAAARASALAKLAELGLSEEEVAAL
jgi:hypothetical protein